MRAGLEVRFEGRQLRRVATVEYPHRRPVLTACARLRGHTANGAVPIANVLGLSVHQATSLLNNARLSHRSILNTSQRSDLAAQDRGDKAVPGFHGHAVPPNLSTGGRMNVVCVSDVVRIGRFESRAASSRSLQRNGAFDRGMDRATDYRSIPII